MLNGCFFFIVSVSIQTLTGLSLLTHSDKCFLKQRTSTEVRCNDSRRRPLAAVIPATIATPLIIQDMMFQSQRTMSEDRLPNLVREEVWKHIRKRDLHVPSRLVGVYKAASWKAGLRERIRNKWADVSGFFFFFFWVTASCRLMCN